MAPDSFIMGELYKRTKTLILTVLLMPLPKIMAVLFISLSALFVPALVLLKRFFAD